MWGIIIGLVLLMFLAFKGLSILWAAPLSAMVVVLLNGVTGADMLGMYTGAYMAGLVGFAQTWFPVFMLGAIFGKLMEFTGMARCIAAKLAKWLGKERAILAIVVACGIMTYGGISLFVVVFAIYPVAMNLFREANISRHLLPGVVALGAFTFTMTAVPGTPQIQNLIPMDHFHTTQSAAPIMGVVSAIIMFVLGCFYLDYRRKQLLSQGLGFVEPEEQEEIDESGLPNFWLSILPLVFVIVTFNVFDFHIIPALVCANVLILLFSYKRYKEFIPAINAGATGSLIAIMNTSAAVGFGAVVREIPAFAEVADMLFAIPGTPLISLAVSVNILAGITGSASGGMGIALTALGERYLTLAYETGVAPAAMHRVAAIASGGLDVLPHNGAVLTVLAITGMTHKTSYRDIAVVAIIIPTIALAVGILLATFGIY